VTAALWPAYLYPGDKPGQDFDPDDIIEGLFRGYLLERVSNSFLDYTCILLIYSGNQAYFYFSFLCTNDWCLEWNTPWQRKNPWNVQSGCRAYCVCRSPGKLYSNWHALDLLCTGQARFGISSLDKWNDKDGYFHYSDFYTRITRLIRNRNLDGEWADSLLAHYNE
jgi:hypothetical protein